MYEGEEMEVAYEQFELEELYGLLGLFGLVYIVSRIEDFFGAVFDAGGWSKPKGYGFNLNEYRQKIESNTGSSLSDSPASFDYIEEMVSARNDFIHRGGEMGNRYKENFPSPRFARQGKIVFTLSHVADATCLLKDFAAFIEAKCRPFSKPLRGKLE